nr:hypothetical protein [uncultured Roseovarius sp.]
MSELQNDFQILTADYMWLRRQFSLLKSLYGRSEERVKLMNELAPEFFSQIQFALISVVVNGLFRIAGSPTTGRGKGEQENLVLKSLIDEERYGMWQGRQELIDLIDKADIKLEPISQMRHKIIAHRDANIARGTGTLKSPMYMDIEAVFDAIDDVIQTGQSLINSTSYCFDPLDEPEDEIELLEYGRIGLELVRKEDDAEFDSLMQGKEHQRNYSDTPAWLE